MRNKMFLVVVMGFMACHNSRPTDAAVAAGDSIKMAMAAADSVRAALKGLAYDYKKDPSCGMPLTAGIEDTARYKGKLYGFCSKECKDAFLKDPETAVAQIKGLAKGDGAAPGAAAGGTAPGGAGVAVPGSAAGGTTPGASAGGAVPAGAGAAAPGGAKK